jgi:predicted glycosyltransferase
VSSPRCLFWVQSLLGSGHLRRALAVAEALAAAGFEVILANGGPPSPWPAPAGVDLVQLPTLASRGADFATLVTADGNPAGEEAWHTRTIRLRALLAGLRPAVLLTEMFPFGRRAFRRELLPLLLEAAHATAPRPLVLASVRDVLVSKGDPGKYRWALEIANASYDAVLVHGDERLFPFGLSFPPAADLAAPILHTGFVVNEPVPAPIGDDAPAVVVSAGGGAVGSALLAASLAARPLTRYRDEPWLLVTGGNVPDAQFERLAQRVEPPVSMARHRPDLAYLIGQAHVSVSQAGYNTVAEGLAAGARMVLVPFATATEDEQTRRAARLADLGLVTHLPEAGLTPDALAAAIDRAAAMPRPVVDHHAFDGASRTAGLVIELLERHAHR